LKSVFLTHTDTDRLLLRTNGVNFHFHLLCYKGLQIRCNKQSTISPHSKARLCRYTHIRPYLCLYWRCPCYKSPRK